MHEEDAEGSMARNVTHQRSTEQKDGILRTRTPPRLGVRLRKQPQLKDQLLLPKPTHQNQ